jgi:putative oxidoreductase
VLVRRIARPLLASTFIFGGLDALRNPASKAPAAGKLDIPSKPGMDLLNITSTEQAVKVNAAAQVAGGALLALGRFPRLASLTLAGSIVPTTLAGHRFWEEDDSAKKKGQLLHFFKNASMLGGLLLASVDTAGKESLAHKTKRVTRRSKRKAAKSAAKATSKAGKKQAAAAHKVREALPV